MSILSLTTVAETMRIAAPYACAAVAGVWAERAGVIQIGLEAVLLASAFGSVAASIASGSAVVGVVAGIAIGVVVSALHAVLVDKTRIDAVVSGIAFNLLGYSATRLGLRALYVSE
jgi:simple sugar transport system permease protein